MIRAWRRGTEDWDTEYLDAICSVALVDGVEGAMAHIARHSSAHTDAIITEDQATANRFLTGVDSAIVMHNASTQFADDAGVRARRGDRHLHGTDACAGSGRARRAHHLQMDRARHRTNETLNRTRPRIKKIRNLVDYATQHPRAELTTLDLSTV